MYPNRLHPALQPFVQSDLVHCAIQVDGSLEPGEGDHFPALISGAALAVLLSCGTRIALSAGMTRS